MAHLELREVGKRFGDQVAVENFDLSAERGEFVVLVGASGCGKSTTLRMIAGLERPTQGRILIDGRNITDADPSERDIAMVFQSYALYPHMNVAQNMSFALRLAGQPKPEIERRVQEAARILGIEALLARKPKELSGGQRQRVAMGRAIVREPKVFLFDEPLSNLDAKLRAHMRVEIALLHERLQKTTVYVTHDQVEAMTLAHRIVVLDRGRIQQVGTPDEIFSRPRNRFVAGFIGSPTMNFLPVRVAGESGEPYFSGPGLRLPVPGAMRATLAARSGTRVTLGIRPHAFRLPPGNGAARLRLQVRLAEFLGNETVLVCATSERSEVPIVACVSGNATALTRGESEFGLDPQALHVFDAENGESIS
jgi:ABC-type sugar transport system ATPase subunit